MIAHFHDVAIYRGCEHNFLGVAGTGLFDPTEHGLKPCAVSTGCYRGFDCTYEVAERSLVLTRLKIGFLPEVQAALKAGSGPRLFGQTPHRYTHTGWELDVETGEEITSWESYDFLIDGFRELVPFNGGLVLAADFMLELYDPESILMPYKFRRIQELIFDAGRLVEEHDRSEQMNEFRRREPALSKEPMAYSRPEIVHWIAETFSLDYRRSPPGQPAS